MHNVAVGSPFGPGPWSVSWWTERLAAARSWKTRFASTEAAMCRFGVGGAVTAPEAPFAFWLAGAVEGPQADTTTSPAIRIARLAPDHGVRNRDARGLREAVRIARMLAAA